MRVPPSTATPPHAAGDPLHEAWDRAREALARVQDPRGSFAGEVRWNGMLVCQWVLTMHMLGRPIPADRARRIRRYLAREVRADGGFPMHPDSGSWMFHTSLALVTLVVLGCDEDDPLVAGARRWIARHGGAYTVPTWGRVWLAMMGLYPWTHVQPALGLPWLLPRRVSLHPSRLYCHLRLIYLGLALVHGRVVRSETSPAFERLRGWLFPEGDRAERFDAHRFEIATTDLYEAPHPLLSRALELGRAAELRAPSWLRRRFLREAFDQIAFEIEHTDGVCLSPVNGMLFCLALHVHGGRRDLLQRALEGVEYWVWEDEEDGMRVAGARSDTWDTSFVLQSLAELPAPVDPRAAAMAGRARAWLADVQMREDAPESRRFDRSSSIGGWGFADERHPWPVSDCTAEALEAVLARPPGPDEVASPDRHPVDVTAAARFMLDRQNPDGGFGSYEARRGPAWLARLNPSEIYGSCMIEASYPECTASCLRGLSVARDAGLEASLRRKVDLAMARGVERLRALQRPSGAWEGVWGVHFTYGTFFAVRGLLAAGVERSDPAIAAACAYLRRRQRADGGWREHCDGLRTGQETSLADAAPSHPTQTAWALLTLMAVSTGPLDPAIQRGLASLRSSQRPDGTWPSPAATGVFFHTAVLDYRLYNLVFPAWALARAVSRQRTLTAPG